MAVMNDVVHDQRVIKEARTLAKAGYDVTVVGLLSDRTTAKENRDGIAIRRIKPFRFSSNHLKIIWEVIRYYRPIFLVGNETQRRVYIELRRIDADIYHAHDLDTLSACSKVAQERGVRVVYDSHELFLAMIRLSIIFPIVGLFYLVWLRWYYGRVEQKYIRHADAVITVNPVIANRLATKYSIPDPLVIYNVPELQKNTVPVDLHKQLDLAPKVKIVVYQGSWNDSRAVPELIVCIEFLPSDYALVLFLTAPQKQMSELQSLARAHHLTPRVFFHDPVPFDDLIKYNMASAVGVIPFKGTNENNRLASPNKLFEFMMSGLPIAATNLPVMGRLIRENRLGELFADTKPKTMAAAIRKVCESPAYREMRRNARQAAEQRFNWAIEAKKLLALYDRLAAASTTRSTFAA